MLFSSLCVNKNNVLVSGFFKAINNPGLWKCYYLLFVDDISKYGLIFYIVLNCALLIAIFCVSIVLLVLASSVLKLKKCELLFAFYFGLLASFICLIGFYNIVMTSAFNTKVFWWNISELSLIIQSVSTFLSVNTVVVYISILFFVLLMIYVHYIVLKKEQWLDDFRSLVYNSLSCFKKPFGWVLACVLFVNIIWVDPKVSVANTFLLSWTVNETSWDINLKNDDKLLKNILNLRSHREKFQNVILIIVDCLRADHLSFNGYHNKTTPFLDSLYDTGFIEQASNATSTCSETLCGIGSTLLSKTYGNMHVKNISLTAILKFLGYESKFFTSDLPNYKGLYEIYGSNVSNMYNCQTVHDGKAFDDAVVLENLKKLDVAGKNEKYFFLFHLLSAHPMGKRFDEFKVFRPAKSIQTWDLTSYDKSISNEYSNYYDDGVLQADWIISCIFKTLGEEGYLEDSIVVIIGDHGEGLGEHGHFHHGKYLYSEYINIPILFIRTKKQKQLHLDYATQVDVSPTILDLLGLNPPECWDGKILTIEHKNRITYHQTTENNVHAIIEKNNNELTKYIEKDGSCVKYNICADKQELFPVKSSCEKFDFISK